MIDSFKSTSDTYVSPPVFLDIGDDDDDARDLLTVQEKVSFPEIVTCLSYIIYYINFSIHLFLDKSLGSFSQS